MTCAELQRRLSTLFLPDASGHAPWQGGDRRYATDPNWRDLLFFHEYSTATAARGSARATKPAGPPW